MAIEFSRFQHRHFLEDFEPFEPPEHLQPAPPPPAPEVAAEAPAAAPADDAAPSNLLLSLPAAPLAPVYVAVGEPPQASVLNELEPTHFELTATATVAANDPAPVAALATAAAAPTTTYVGEPPVTADWLAARETAFTAIRSDYEAQRAAAQAQAGSGPGWVDAVMVTDESGRSMSASGAATVFIADPGATPQIVGYDESGPVYSGPAGRYVEFSEDAFAAHYRAQGGAPLQTLASLYDTDAGTLLARHPELWRIATTEHALNAGPPPAGRAMGDAGQLAMLDLYMADPQVADLIQRYGGSVAPATSGIALEQVRIHGQARYEQMTRLANAMQAVRTDYSNAMQHAMAHGGPGWVEQPRMVTTTDESGVTRTEQMVSRDESGVATPLTERFFDPDRFTAWYVEQGGAANKAFASFYGQSHTQWGTDESGARVISSIGFDNANWQMGGAGGPMSHNDLRSLDPNHAPRLNNDSAVGFDFEAGWATHHSNIYQKRDVLGQIIQIAAVAAVGYFTFGAVSAWAGSSAGLGLGAGSTGALVVGSAAAGAASSFVSGAMNGDLSLKNVLRGALSGALTAGLVGPVGNALGGSAAAGVVARMTVQGGIQALLGGKFEEGAIAGLASGLAELSGAQINKSIDDALKAGTMSAGEALAARGLARVFSSAVRTLGSPGDPQYAFASDLVGSIVNAGLDATQPAPAPTFTGTVFDDDGNLMPGMVDANATPVDQASQIAEQLQRQGLSQDEAVSLAGDWLQDRLGAPQVALAPPSEESGQWSPQELEARVADVEQRLAEDLAAQQAREDSLLGPDELQNEVGGPGGTRPPIQPVLNGRVDLALNAASDVAGLLQPLADIRGAIGQLQAAQAEAAIESLRGQLRAAGVTNVPADYERAWVQGGNSVRDYGATMDRLQSIYNDHLSNQRLTQTWGENWRDVRIGRSQMTPVEFEKQVLQVQQQAANDAYTRGVAAIASKQLPLKNDDYALTLGAYIDEQVRLELRTFGAAQGLPDTSASNVFAVNRQIRGQAMVGIPDLRLGYNLLSDVSLARKDSNTTQLQRWNLIRPNDTIIVRPDQLGGAYVVPRATIPAPRVPGRGG